MKTKTSFAGKKLISVLLTALMLLGCCSAALPAAEATSWYSTDRVWKPWDESISSAISTDIILLVSANIGGETKYASLTYRGDKISTTDAKLAPSGRLSVANVNEGEYMNYVRWGIGESYTNGHDNPFSVYSEYNPSTTWLRTDLTIASYQSRCFYVDDDGYLKAGASYSAPRLTYAVDDVTVQDDPFIGSPIRVYLQGGFITTYPVTFQYYNDSNALTTLTTDHYEMGQAVSYSGALPSRTATAQYSYSFAGWKSSVDGSVYANDALPACSGAVTYTAQFTETTNKYTITWNNQGGGTLGTTPDIPYGTTPDATYYHGDPPAAPADADPGLNYSFSGWTPGFSMVTGNQTYTAAYTTTPKMFTITWKWTDADGEHSTTEQVSYNTTPARAKAADYSTASTVYTSTGWAPVPVPATADATYTAQYSSATRQYDVTWNNQYADPSLIYSEKVDYGVTPAYNETAYGPVQGKTNDPQWSYTFLGWNTTADQTAAIQPEPVTTNIDYWAAFRADLRSYAVTFTQEDGETAIGNAQTLTYGSTPTAPAEDAVPGKAPDNYNSYAFSGWTVKGTTTFYPKDAALPAVEGPVTYVATYEPSTIYYTVSFVQEDGETLIGEAQSLGYDGVPAAPAEADVPAKGPDNYNTYAFSGWTLKGTETFIGKDDAIPAVTGSAIYVATYEPSTIYYTVSFVQEDGETLIGEAQSLGYDGVPAAPAEATVPAKEPDNYNTYAFSGWTLKGTETFIGKDDAIPAVTGSVTYVATYTPTPILYAVSFVTEDGASVIENKQLGYDAVLTAPDEADVPTKDPDNYNTYAFSGWTVQGTTTFCAKDAALPNVTGPVTYVATYAPSERKYSVTFVQEDCATAIGDPQSLSYEAPPVKPAETDVPAKRADAQYTYEFSGWTVKGTTDFYAKDAALPNVTDDVIYVATYEPTLRSYTVTFKNGDDALQSGQVDYGVSPTAPAAPAKDDTEQYTYSFTGWTDQNGGFVAKDAAFPPVEGDITYSAVFDETVRTYPVTWNNWDGTLLKTDPVVAYGETPSYDGATPEKAADPYQYVFAGWTPDVAPVAGPQTYTAVFTTQPAKITYVTDGANGTVSGDMTIVRTVGEDYQTDWRPDVTPDAGWTCTFVGEPDVITGDVTVTIRFEKAPDMWVTVTYYSDGNGFLYGTNQREVLKGTAYDVRWRPVPGPFPGYRFSEWENEPEGAVNSDVVITARFVEETADGSQISCFEKLVRLIQEFFMRIAALFSHSGSTSGSSGGSYGSDSASGGSSGGSYGSTGA